MLNMQQRKENSGMESAGWGGGLILKWVIRVGFAKLLFPQSPGGSKGLDRAALSKRSQLVQGKSQLKGPEAEGYLDR